MRDTCDRCHEEKEIQAAVLTNRVYFLCRACVRALNQGGPWTL